jgi:REP element-mobilizing transposase RayT
LAELGRPHYGRRAVQPEPPIVRDFYDRARERLVFPIIHFNADQIQIIAQELADAMKTHHYTCYACALLPDHVHIVIRKHKHRAEQMIHHLQAASRLRLSSNSAVPPNHPIWTLAGWRRFLASPSAVRSVIRYVENNPAKNREPQQSWPFVAPYDNWPFRPNRPR